MIELVAGRQTRVDRLALAFLAGRSQAAESLRAAVALCLRQPRQSSVEGVEESTGCLLVHGQRPDQCHDPANEGPSQENVNENRAQHVLLVSRQHNDGGQEVQNQAHQAQ